MHAALTSVLCAIWLTIERNKTLTLRVQKGDIDEQRNEKNYEMLLCNVLRSSVICSNMAAYY